MRGVTLVNFGVRSVTEADMRDILTLRVRRDVARVIINNLRIAAARLKSDDRPLSIMLDWTADDIERQAHEQT